MPNNVSLFIGHDRMKERLLAGLGPILGFCLFCLAILILQHELERFHFHDILAHLNTIQTGGVLLAFCLTILSYVALTPATMPLRFGTSTMTLPIPASRSRLSSATFSVTT